MRLTLQPYQPRSIRFLELWRENGWEVKVYGICALHETLEDRFVEAAKEIARQKLPQPPVTASRYGVGCITIHPAKLFNQIIVNWWERDNELRHHVFKAQPETPYLFEDITATGEAFCVWELRVIGFERDAWLERVLRNANETTNDYLNCRLNEDV